MIELHFPASFVVIFTGHNQDQCLRQGIPSHIVLGLSIAHWLYAPRFVSFALYLYGRHRILLLFPLQSGRYYCIDHIHS